MYSYHELALLQNIHMHIYITLLYMYIHSYSYMYIIYIATDIMCSIILHCDIAFIKVMGRCVTLLLHICE